MNKTDRLHHITKLLRVRRRITLAELMSETRASRATLMRDLARACHQSIPTGLESEAVEGM